MITSKFYIYKVLNTNITYIFIKKQAKNVKYPKKTANNIIFYTIIIKNTIILIKENGERKNVTKIVKQSLYRFQYRTGYR